MSQHWGKEERYSSNAKKKPLSDTQQLSTGTEERGTTETGCSTAINGKTDCLKRALADAQRVQKNQTAGCNETARSMRKDLRDIKQFTGHSQSTKNQ
jgi:phosphoketolase